MTEQSMDASLDASRSAASLELAERILANAEDRAIHQRLEDGLQRVEDGLREQLRFTNPIADAAGRYLMEAGGKRVRPLLTLLVSELGSGPNEQVIKAAQTVEITHLASLYHDDVMDEAGLRRGVASAHLVWGNSVAILAGDLLFARASRIISALGERAIALQADTFERLCLGQLAETVGPQPGDDETAFYLQVLADKTGSLIAAAARLGAIFGGAPEEQVVAVGRFGERVGVAFQIVDDVIDLSPHADRTGKRAGTDIRAGVRTLPMLHLLSVAQEDPAAEELADRILRGVAAETAAHEEGQSEPSAELDTAIAELAAHPATARARQDAARWSADAVAALDPLPDGQVKEALIRFAHEIVDRHA